MTGNAERVEALDYELGAFATRLLELVERGGHVLRMREVQPEHVNLVALIDGAELDAGNHAHAERCARGLCGRYSVDRVVIGERDRGESGALCGGDDVSRSDRTVGRRGVHVEIHVALRRRTRLASEVAHAR